VEYTDPSCSAAFDSSPVSLERLRDEVLSHASILFKSPGAPQDRILWQNAADLYGVPRSEVQRTRR
jgi:hypothetical protein